MTMEKVKCLHRELVSTNLISLMMNFYLVVAGGTFALYSLICRHAKVSLLPNRQVADEALSTYKLEPPPATKNSSRVKTVLENHKSLHIALLILVLLGTCMVIGDGLLTPAISGKLSRLAISCSAFMKSCKCAEN